MGHSRILSLLALGPFVLAAAEENPKKKTKAEVSATVTVTAEAVPVEMKETPNPVVVIDAERIERSGAKSLAELIAQELPGQILPYGGPGAASPLKLNGSRAQDTVILLDGIRISDPTTFGSDLGRIGLEGIERVEILIGPASSRYGADAHGGVIALYSAGRARQGFSATLAGGVGTQGIRKGRFAPSLGWTSGWVRGSLDGNREALTTGSKEPFRSAGGSFGFGQEVGTQGLFTLAYQNHYLAAPLPFNWDFDYTTYTSVRAYAPEREYSHRSQSLVGAFRWAFTPTLLGEMSVGHILNERMEVSYFVPGVQDPTTSQRNQGIAHLTWSPSERFGATWTLEGNEEGGRFFGQPGLKGRHTAVGMETRYEPVSGFRIVGSARKQWDYLSKVAPSSTGMVPEHRGGDATFKLGANWMLPTGTQVFASYGSAYNTPQLFQIGYNQGKGFPPLIKERSRSLQVGGRWERSGWSVRGHAFRTQYRDALAYVGLWPSDHYENAARLRIQGVEGAFGYQAKEWGAEVTARSQEARNTGVGADQQLLASGAPGRPFASFGARGHAVAGAYRIDVRWSYVGGGYHYFDDLGDLAANKSHFNDLSVIQTWSFSSDLAVTLRGEHLLQTRWSREDWMAGRTLGRNDTYLIPDYPAQGPALSLELRYRF